MTSAPSTPDLLAHQLETTRTRTLALAELDDDELVRQHSVLMSPLVWDLAHIGQQEDLWLLRDGDPRRQGLLSARVEQLYDAFEHPRAERPGLPLLPPHESRTFLSDVRGRVLERLERAHDLFAFAMVLQHEVQHGETMLATHQLRTGPPALGAGTPLPAGRPVPADSVLVPAGRFVLGVDADDEPFSLDNERPAHLVDLPAFRIGRVPVTVGEWQQFAADGGYDEPHWWSAPGWQHRTSQRVDAPLHWSLDGSRRRFGHVEALPPSEPVQHVDYFEAEAYAAWAGGRLPTEQEWEKACCWDPVLGRRRRWPWGEQAPADRHANLGGTALRPAPVGSYPAGASAYGVEQLIGDVWEWTSSPLRPWPGFTPMIYDSYSAPFFGGDYRVLRGGSWATTAGGTRPSFRNWDHPVRRQIFTGVRVAWDA